MAEVTGEASPAPTLSMRGIRKRFGGVVALGGVDLEVRAGEIHALLGENGAGKSTLMKILAGAEAADEGAMTLAGQPYAPRSPLEGRDAGVAMIYQELTLATHLSIEANLLLGRERQMAPAAARAALRSLGVGRDPATRVAKLGPGERQLVEIARALASEASVVVLDEPTSSLGPVEIERVFAAMRHLRERGKAVVFISHHLDEVRAVADRYTVMRDGSTVATGRITEANDDELIAMMVGRPVRQLFPERDRTPGKVLLTVDSLTGRQAPVQASIELHQGEILGIAGLVGAGRTEFLRAVFGLDPVAEGSISVGVWVDGGAAPPDRYAQGIGLLSEDRKSEGIALRLPIWINLLLPSLDEHATHGLLKSSSLDAAAKRAIERLGVKTRSPQQAARELSGGNQQKLALARLLERDVDVFLLDEPTRGIDVGSKSEIYHLLDELARRGKAILVVSSVTSELLGLCDRIAVMSRGRLGAPRPAAEWTEESILLAASVGEERAA